jgi:hypothetical protein
VSALLTEHEDITELDINPLVPDPADPSGAPLALDALIVLGLRAGGQQHLPGHPAPEVPVGKTGEHHG